jgi:hypothetical protein
MKRTLGFLLILVLATAVGCSQGSGRQYANVKGTVKYNGKPVEKGEISFTIEGNPPSAMDIIDGEFHGQAMVGSNKVSVIALKKSATGGPKLDANAKAQIQGYMKYKREDAGNSSSNFDPTMVDYMPPEWGTNSKHRLVVEAGAPNDFTIIIKGN